MLKRWNPDVVALNEVPGGDWTDRVAKRAGMAYSYVGIISSADMMGILNANGTEGGYFKGKVPKDIEFKPNKFKSILSRKPSTGAREVPISGLGWQPASAVRAETVIKGRPLVIYSLHIAGDRAKPEGTQAADLAGSILAKETDADTVVMGDFNNQLGPVMDVFETAGFTNLWKATGMDVTKQFSFSAIKGRPSEGVIDHILFKSPQAAYAIQGGIIELNKPLSDHKPVWGDIRFGVPVGTTTTHPPAS